MKRPHPSILAATVGDLGLAMTPLAVVATPAIVIAAVADERTAMLGLAVPIVVGIAGGLVAHVTRRYRHNAEVNHGLVITAAWLIAAIVASMPFLIAAWLTPSPNATLVEFRDPLNGLLEAMSGLTSTGLTVSLDPRELPLALQWWRSTTQWLGGVGILYFGLAVIGLRGHMEKQQEEEAGDELNEADEEEHGPSLRRALVRTWIVYGILTVATFAGLWLAGMPLWDAANHAQAAIATGGFALPPDSLASYGRASQAVIAAAMTVGAVSFFALRRIIHFGEWRHALRDHQIHWLAGMLIVGVLGLWGLARVSGEGLGLFDATFNFISALATCGFSTSPAESLPWAPMMWLAVAMVLGGSAGSTAGGIKIGRVRRLAWRAVGKRVDTPTPDEPIRKAAKIVIGFVVAWLAGAVLLAVVTPVETPLRHVIFEAASAVGTVGLSTGVTHPDLSPWGRLTLVLLMWIGRLEILAVLALFVRRLR